MLQKACMTMVKGVKDAICVDSNRLTTVCWGSVLRWVHHKTAFRSVLKIHVVGSGLHENWRKGRSESPFGCVCVCPKLGFLQQPELGSPPQSSIFLARTGRLKSTHLSAVLSLAAAVHNAILGLCRGPVVPKYLFSKIGPFVDQCPKEDATSSNDSPQQ